MNSIIHLGNAKQLYKYINVKVNTFATIQINLTLYKTTKVLVLEANFNVKVCENIFSQNLFKCF